MIGSERLRPFVFRWRLMKWIHLWMIIRVKTVLWWLRVVGDGDTSTPAATLFELMMSAIDCFGSDSIQPDSGLDSVMGYVSTSFHSDSGSGLVSVPVTNMHEDSGDGDRFQS
ncbi:hypothetical protein Hanom_Chr15g01402191 [Helianthus anomalus]